MESNRKAWNETLLLLPWIVISVGLSSILCGVYSGLSTDASLSGFFAGILTCWVGAMWLYNRNR